MSSLLGDPRTNRFKPTPPPSSPAGNTPTRADCHRTPSESAERGNFDNSSDTEDDSGDIIMAVDQRGQRLGCSYYTIATGTLSLMEDISIPDNEMLMTLKYQIKPTVILVPSRLDDAFRKPEHAEEDGFRVSIRPATEFSPDVARGKLMSLNIGEPGIGPMLHILSDQHDGDGDEGLDRSRLLKLAAWITVDSRVAAGCAGAVLAYLQRRAAIEAGGGDGKEGLRVHEVEMVTLKNCVMVNAETIAALRVFEQEDHPRAGGEGGRGKEGLSLFGILNHTRSPLGQRMLRQWFLRPTMDIEILNARHDSIAVLLRAENLPVTTSLSKSCSKIKNIPKIFASLKRGKASGYRGGEWAHLLHFIFHVLKMRTLLAELVIPSGEHDIPISRKFSETVDMQVLQHIGQDITNIIDFEESTLQGRVVIKQHVDEGLDEMKRSYEGMESMLSEVAREIAGTLPAEVQNLLNVIYFPQIGYLLVMPSVAETMPDGVTVTESSTEEVRPAWVQNDWEFQFFTGACWYYKNPQMRELDDWFGDMYGNICDREIEIIHELQVRTLEHEKLLMDCVYLAAELDCLVALTIGAEKYKYCRPIVTEENVIKITKGRHPIQELIVPSFIENDTLLVGGDGTDLCSPRPAPADYQPPSLLLLTGPNYSGKSLHLKQICLIVYLAHIGSFVPASSATIGIVDKILTHLQTRESVSRNQSAFVLDLQSISSALRAATDHSLLVIDEFGKGTDPVDGAGLVAAVIEDLVYLRTELNRPKVAIATHYHELFEPPNPIIPSKPGEAHPAIRFAHFKIRLDPAAEQVDGQITYLYSLEPGRSSGSFGTVCAALNGVSKEIVDKAEDLVIKMARGEDLVSVLARGSREEERDAERAEIVARRFLVEFQDEGGDEDEAGNGSVRERLVKVLGELGDGVEEL